MATSSIKVLVAEDFDMFRQFIVSLLKDRLNLPVIAEVADGLDAVEKARELRPDLVLMDIGLPRLNGIEAARRICQFSPESKILFVSQESALDVVHAALATGAQGYVVKADMGSELLVAIDSMLRGERFLGRRFAEHDLSRASGLEERQVRTAGHEAAFYSSDASFLDGFTQFMGKTLQAGDAVIVVATEPHRKGLFQRLGATGLDIEAAIAEGRCIPLDAAETLATFMVNDMPDPDRFLKIVCDLILGAAKAVNGEYHRVTACGECAPLLWSQGHAEAAIRVEQLWDEVSRTYGLNILCGYTRSDFHSELGHNTYRRISAVHSAVQMS